jgi:hypothetical protein
MNLKEAREKKKIAKLIKEHGKEYPQASKHHFHAVLKSMVSGTAKPKRGTSRKGSRAG